MKRLVYSPKVNAYVRTDYGVIDISPYITAGGVQRKLDAVSSAKLTIRNPGKKWTHYEYTDPVTKKATIGPIFHPMDPITIFLTRLANKPVQVFTGFLDQTPYLQLFPGTVSLQASCTLKKLEYTYYDAGLPFFNEFLTQYGWSVMEGVGIINPGAEGKKATEKGALTDSGFGDLLYGVINQIAGFPDEAIFIEKIPNDLIELVTTLFDAAKEASKESNEEMIELLHEIIGTASLGSGGFEPTGNAGGAGPPPKTAVTPVDVGRAMLTGNDPFPSDRRVLAQGMAVVNVESTFGHNPAAFTPNTADCVGYWQLQLSTHNVTEAEANDLVQSTAYAKGMWQACGGSFSCDWYNFEAGASSTAEAYQPYLVHADKAIQMGPFERQPKSQNVKNEWGSGEGNFKTQGNYGSSSVRG